MSAKIPKPRRRSVAKAIGGLVAFLGVGLLLTPGLLERKASTPEGRSAAATAPPPEASIADSAPDEAGAWLDDVRDVAPAIGDPLAPNRAFDCMIGPSEVADVGSAITGLIDEILVERSDYVEAGDVVARLEASVEEAAVRVARARAERTDDILTARANLALTEKRLARARELREQDVLSLDRLQEAETQHELALHELERAQEDHRVAKLQLEQARAALDRRTIRSPVSGIVTERLLGVGEVVDEETVLRIARVDPLRVEAILPAEWFGRAKPGEQAEVVPEAPLETPRDAEVVIVDRVLDGASGTFGVELDLPNGDRALPAGLRCQVRFTGERPALARPERPPSLAGLAWESGASVD